MNWAQYIDHTYLKADAKISDIDKLINEAKEYNFKTICINPHFVEYAKSKLNNSTIGITTVIGFPLGSNTTKSKVFEAKDAIKNGADEIDIVINISWLKDKKYELIVEEIKSIKKKIKNHVLKVIIETALLSNEEIKKATELVLTSGADFVKTSTGFSTRGASFDDIEIMKKVVKNKIGIKAAGGVKTFEDMKKMISLGATRIGTSSGVALIKNQENKEGY